MMKARITAGPACSAAAWPVITKMPPPMTAPIPNAVSPHGPSVRRRAGPWESSTLEKSVLRASSCFSMGVPDMKPARFSPCRRVHRVRRREGSGRFGAVGQMALAVAVEEVDHQPDRTPHEEGQLGLLRQVEEQQQAADDRKRADQPRHRGAERARAIRLRATKDQH